MIGSQNEQDGSKIIINDEEENIQGHLVFDSLSLEMQKAIENLIKAEVEQRVQERM